MDTRRLGRSDLHIAPLVLGGNVFGWTVDEAMSFTLLDAFLAAGFNCIDTADIYSIWVPGHHGGESETIIGRWLESRGARDRIIIATKVGDDMGTAGKGLSRDHIMRSVEASLRRLRTDRIDLYQSHRDDESTPLEETLEAYARLVAHGKVRAIGASNHSAARLREALSVSAGRDWPRYESLQPNYNLYDRADFEGESQALCVAQGLGVIPYYSLASGFLTGKYRTPEDFHKSPRGAAMAARLNERGLRILGALDRIAAERDATPAQVALAWLAARPGVTAPIASATTLGQLDDLIRGVRLGLDGAATLALDTASRY
jgi:aryl-alcohol dehydrogenase-like predicted oxidoreductase